MKIRPAILLPLLCLALTGCETASRQRISGSISGAFQDILEFADFGAPTGSVPEREEPGKAESQERSEPEPVAQKKTAPEPSVPESAAPADLVRKSADAHAPPACPNIEVPGPLRSMTRFTTMDAPAPEKMVTSIRMSSLAPTCLAGENSVRILLDISFDGTLGPKGRSAKEDRPAYSFPYFVAVTDWNGRILSKDVFAVLVDYPPGTRTARVSEALKQDIAPAGPGMPEAHAVILGFQLGPDELAYNRAQGDAEAALTIPASSIPQRPR